MKNDDHLPALTPCAGRCSTVFGDQVCRGCRRFNHEVIHWNTYTAEQQLVVWQRLDSQLDQILVAMLPSAHPQQVDAFISSKRVRLLPNASWGRKLYHALRLCEKNRYLAEQSGLGLTAQQIQPFWQEFERRILALAQASYDLAWLRADGIHHHLLEQLAEDESV